METTRDFRKFKRGTIGYSIHQLVKKHGQGSNGIYILESALKEVCGMPSHSLIKIGALPVDETPGVVRIRAEEARIMAELRKEGVIK